MIRSNALGVIRSNKLRRFISFLPVPFSRHEVEGQKILPSLLTAAVWIVLMRIISLQALSAWGSAHDIRLTNLLYKWDAIWMTWIAANGYGGDDCSTGICVRNSSELEWKSVAFFPGYPMLVRLFGNLLDAAGYLEVYYDSAVFISFLAALAFAVILSQLCWEFMVLPLIQKAGKKAEMWQATATSLAVSTLAIGAPMGMVYWMPYTEGLFSALAMGGILMLLRKKYGWAALWIGLSGLVRMTATGFIFTLGLSALILSVRAIKENRALEGGESATTTSFPWKSFPWRVWGCVILSALPLILYIMWASYQSRSFGFLGYFGVQKEGWDSHFDYGRSTVHWLGMYKEYPGDYSYIIVNISVFMMLALILMSLIALWRGWIPWQLWLPAMITALMVLGSAGVIHSRPRLLLLPVAIYMLPWVSLAIARLSRRAAAMTLIPVILAWAIYGWWVSGYFLVLSPWAI